MNIAQYIDHTLVRADATPEEVRKLCGEALKYGFASVCVHSAFVLQCAEHLDGRVPVCSVVGFPLGAMHTDAKRFETMIAIENGATEIDMVMHIGLLKSGELNQAQDDIAHVVEEARGGNALVKVIIEAALLTDDEKRYACQMVVGAGADFVKTSTGFSTSGAKVEDVALMRKVVGPNFGVKASGGIKTYADALAMIEAGANRLGCSAGVQIVKEALKV